MTQSDIPATVAPEVVSVGRREKTTRIGEMGLIRRPASAVATGKPGIARTLLIGCGASVGLFAVATAGFMAFSSLTGIGKKGTIQVGKLNLPDLQDGVPPLAPSGASVRVIPGAPVSAPAPVAAAAAPSVPTSPSGLTAALASSNPDGSPRLPTPAPAGAPQPGKLPVVLLSPKPVAPPQPLSPPLPSAQPKPVAAAAPSTEPVPVPPARFVPGRAVASLETEAGLRPGQLPATTSSITAPLPPSAPARAADIRPTSVEARPTEAKPAEAKPNRVAARPVRRDRVADPTTTATINTKTAPAEEDHIDVFGLKLPTIGTTANRLKESVDALGDAVRNLPGTNR